MSFLAFEVKNNSSSKKRGDRVLEAKTLTDVLD
jgi:hypothetical protein